MALGSVHCVPTRVLRGPWNPLALRIGSGALHIGGGYPTLTLHSVPQPRVRLVQCSSPPPTCMKEGSKGRPFPARGGPLAAPAPEGPTSTSPRVPVQCTIFLQVLCPSRVLLAPKKKGPSSAGGGGASGSPRGAGGGGGPGKGDGGYDHIFNIYKDIDEDHKLLPDACYPKWLWQLQGKPKSYGQLAMMFLYGKVRCKGRAKNREIPA
ncbi:hypothetical protein cyc_00049 [Cyclospora cayetanensis]|uniref:Uncharacterized protein n=1 Tax=Cyclospora cayetanensis TaxID=88456 RepID=A0A1D3CVG9_9EIME|nr:hypothetical protein cyc_00049 [Cyclospora cayetanensis]